MNDRLLTVECLSHSAAVTSQLEHEEAEVWDQDVALTNDQLGQKIDKSDKAIGKLAERIAAVEGKFSAPQKQSHPGIVALWGLAGAVVLAFWGWMANGVVTQGNRLTGIEEGVLNSV